VQGVRCHCLSIRGATPDGGEAIFQCEAIERLERQCQKDADALAQHPRCVGRKPTVARSRYPLLVTDLARPTGQ